MSDITFPTVVARAPVRVDLAGGWTDVAEFCQQTPGYTLSLAITRHVAARAEPIPGGLEIISTDYGERTTVDSVAKLELGGHLDLLKVACRRLPPPPGTRLTVASDVPPQSGLGTSAATGVATLAVLAHLLGRELDPVELAETASSLEKDDLDIEGGKQDHYASAQGGIRFMTFHGETVSSTRLDVSTEQERELLDRMVLAHSGAAHQSGDVHSTVRSRWEENDHETLDAIEKLKKLTLDARDALEHGDIDSFGEIVQATWVAQKSLHPDVTTKRLDDLFLAATGAGAIGGKACGAGGGGCLVLITRSGKADEVTRSLEAAGAQVIPVGLDRDGVTTRTLP